MDSGAAPTEPWTVLFTMSNAPVLYNLSLIPKQGRSKHFVSGPVRGVAKLLSHIFWLCDIIVFYHMICEFG